MADDWVVPEEDTWVVPPEAPLPGGDAIAAVGKTAKQVPLGAARGVMSMLSGAAPSFMAEAAARNPRITEQPAPQTYIDQGEQFLKETGVNSPENMPSNMAERMASGAGEAVPWAVASGFPGMAGNVLVGMGGGAAGEGAKEFAKDPNGKTVAGIIGNIFGSFGTAGALAIARGIFNSARPLRKFPGDEFKIPATQGMTGEDLYGATPRMQSAEEQAMERGARGYTAQKIMEGNRLEREEAIARATDDFFTQTGGERATPEEAAGVVSHGLQGRAEKLRSTADSLYESAAAKNPWAVAEDFRPTLAIDDALTAEGLKLDMQYGNHPVSKRAYELINRLDRGKPFANEDKFKGIEGRPEARRVLSLAEMESVSKKLRSMKASKLQPEDGLHLEAIRKAYANWERGVIENALFVGDKTALDDLARAKPMWARYRRMTDADPKNDYTKVISDIVGRDRTNEEVANYLFNLTSLNHAARASRVARYVKRSFGEGSEEVQALRQGFMHKAMTPANDRVGAGHMARQIENAFDGKGAPLARALFSQEEISRALRYAQTLRQSSPPLENPSRSGYEVGKHLWAAVTGLAATAGIAASYHNSDWRWLGLATLPFVRDVKNAQRALTATRKTMSAPTVPQRTMMGVAPEAGPNYTEDQP